MPEVVGSWVKAAASSPSGNCVEMAELDNGNVGLRNSRHPEGGFMEFTRGEIAALVQGAREGDFDQFVA